MSYKYKKARTEESTHDMVENINELGVMKLKSLRKLMNCYIKKEKKMTKCVYVLKSFQHKQNLTCEDNTIILYKVTNAYNPNYEKKINIFREKIYPPINIKKMNIIISHKDS